MTFNKKSDVMMHLSPSGDRRVRLIQQVDRPAAPALPVRDLAIESIASVFAEDFSLEHTSPGGAVSAVGIVANSDESILPSLPKSPKVDSL